MTPERFRPAAARCLALVLVVVVSAGFATAQRVAGAAAARSVPGVFVLVTVDKTTWEPYEYGSAFFFNSAVMTESRTSGSAPSTGIPSMNSVGVEMTWAFSPSWISCATN